MGIKTKDRRRELRLSREDEELITEAAALSGTTFTGFVLEEAIARAREIVEAHPVPIVLLARLAIDTTEQGRGLGISLLFEALHRASLARRAAGTTVGRPKATRHRMARGHELAGTGLHLPRLPGAVPRPVRR